MRTGSVAPVAVTTMSAGRERWAKLGPRNRAAFELPRQSFGGRERATRDGDLVDALRAQVDAGELGHLAGTEDEHVPPGEITEDLPRQFDCRVADRNGALAEAGFAAHSLADGEGRMEQAMRHRAGELQLARGCVGRLDLTKNLRLADDERVEAGRDAEEMPRRVDAAVAVQVLGETRRVDFVVVAKEAPEGVAGGIGFADGVDLGAIAGRENDSFLAPAVRAEGVQRRVESAPSEINGFAQLYGRRTMAEANSKKPHVV